MNNYAIQFLEMAASGVPTADEPAPAEPKPEVSLKLCREIASNIPRTSAGKGIGSALFARTVSMPLTPRVRTAVSGEGGVVFHDQTRYGLCRMCVACYDKYPDLELWLGMLHPNAKPHAYRYVEKIEADILFIGYLWIYYKIGR